LIIDFARLWDASMRFDYREYRQQIKNLALNNAANCDDANILNYSNYLKHDRSPDSWYYFTDDDDWISPEAFSYLKGLNSEAAVWGSIYIGQLYTDSETAKAADQVVNFRDFNPTIFYTNNYALKGSTLDRVGDDKLVEHYDAQASYDRGEVHPFKIDAYLSAANKHPCCTMAILYNIKSEVYRRDMKGALEKFTCDLDRKINELDSPWLIKNIEQLVGLNKTCLNL